MHMLHDRQIRVRVQCVRLVVVTSDESDSD